MKRYYVSVTEHLNKVVSVAAESEEEAVKKTQKAYDNCDIVLDSDNFTGEVVQVEPDQEFYVDYEKDYGETYQHIDQSNEECSSLLTINQNIEIMKYYVSVTEMLNTVVRVEAESEKEAIDKAKYEYSDGVIELTREDNYSGEQFEIDDDQEYWREAEENGNTVLQHIDQPNGESNLPTNNQNIIDMKKIEVGMKVYCDIHSQSKEHIVTHDSEKRGFAGIDNEFWWPIDQCFPCDEVTLPKKRS